MGAVGGLPRRKGVWRRVRSGGRPHSTASSRSATPHRHCSLPPFPEGRYGHTDTVKFLLEPPAPYVGFDLEREVQKPNWTSLHRAAANGHEATVRELLRDLPKDARGGRHCGSPPTVAGEAEPALTRDPTLNDQQFVSIKLRDHQNDAGVQTAMKMMIGM